MVFKSKTNDIYRESNHFSMMVICELGNNYRIRLPYRMANSCHGLQSLIFMMLHVGHMEETHTDGIPVQFIIFFDFDI